MFDTDPAVFAAVFAALYAAHEVGDHWVQRECQALGKGVSGWSGRWACVRHVASLTLVKMIALGLLALVTTVSLNPMAVTAALGVDAAAHYWADRRTPLAWLARLCRKGGFYRLGDGGAAPTGTGAYALDQSFHIGWLFLAALIASLGGGT